MLNIVETAARINRPKYMPKKLNKQWGVYCTKQKKTVLRGATFAAAQHYIHTHSEQESNVATKLSKFAACKHSEFIKIITILEVTCNWCNEDFRAIAAKSNSDFAKEFNNANWKIVSTKHIHEAIACPTCIPEITDEDML